MSYLCKIAQPNEWYHQLALATIYMHRLKWSLITKWFVCLSGSDQHVAITTSITTPIPLEHVWSRRDGECESLSSMFAAMEMRIVKPRRFAGLGVRGTVRTRGFVDLGVEAARATYGFSTPRLADKSLARCLIKFNLF